MQVCRSLRTKYTTEQLLVNHDSMLENTALESQLKCWQTARDNRHEKSGLRKPILAPQG